MSERANAADYFGEASWRRESSDSRGGRRAGMQGRSPLCGDPRSPTVPGLEQILRGYNVYTAAPLSDKGYDPSFHGNLIFKESCERQATTGDCAHSVPDGLQLVPRVVCSFNFASKEVASLSDYAVSLHDFVSISGLEVEGSVSASAA